MRTRPETDDHDLFVTHHVPFISAQETVTNLSATETEQTIDKVHAKVDL